MPHLGLPQLGAALFPDFTEAFVQKEAAKKAPKEGEEKRPAKPKKVQIIQPPKDQNMNIMLAQFGKIKFSELAESMRPRDCR